MSGTELTNLVELEREQLLDGKDGIEAAVVTRPNRSQTVAVGLLALDDVDEAKAWFRALTEEWLIYAGNSWDARYEKEPRQSAQRGPWKDYVNAVYCALLGRQDVEDVADTVYERATEDFVDDLENRSLAHRIDLARGLSSYILDTGMVEEQMIALEEFVQERDKPWAVARYLPYAQVLRGLDVGDVSQVLTGIEGLLNFHQDHVASARDAGVVQKAVALDATAMLALARREGMALTVEHDAIPVVLNDDEHYPVGNEK